MSVPYLGKRNPGGLTAASPGDTLYFPYASFNDSGDSESQSGFAVSDIEVFRDGQPTARATDSGYSLISDTGQMGDRAGLNRFAITIYNTSDDTGFYQSGSWYQVAVDAVTIDGKTVRFWAGQFELDTPRANIVALDGDTGFADRLGKFASLLTAAGLINAANVSEPLAADVQELDGDTGAATQLQQAFATTPTYLQRVDIRAVLGDTGAAHLDQGRFGVISDSGRQAAVLDTGKVAAAIWTSHATRTLTAFALDTGIRDTIWRASPSSYTSDTGSFGYAAGRLMAVRNDTGAAHLDGGRLGVSATVALDTGQINRVVWQADASRTLTAFAFDTGIWGSNFAGGRTLTSFIFDTGVAHTVWASASRTLTAFAFDTGIWGSNFASGRTLTAFAFDTGVADTVWKYGDTGLRTVNMRKLFGDTGAAVHLSQAFAAQSTNSDTGLIANAAAIRTQTDKLTFDTGANELHADIRKVNNLQIQGAGDTGTASTWRPI